MHIDSKRANWIFVLCCFVLVSYNPDKALKCLCKALKSATTAQGIEYGV